MFIGEYLHSIDDKNRVSLPKVFREGIDGRVVLTRGLDSCVFMYRESDWEEIAQKIANLGFAQADSRGLNRFLLSAAQVADIDKAGRILLPPRLKEFAEINDKAVFAGVYNRVEVWQPKTWEKYKDSIESGADKLAERLGDVGMI